MTTEVAIICNKHKCLCNMSEITEDNFNAYSDFFYEHRLCDLTIVKLCSSYDYEDEGYAGYKII